MRAAGAVPEPVGRRVFAPGCGIEHIELHATGVDQHVIRDLASAERVEAETDPVVLPDVVAPRDRRLDAARLGVVAAEREIQRVGVVADPHRRVLRHTVAVQRVVGEPVAGGDRLSPFGFADDPVDTRRIRGGVRVDRRSRLCGEASAGQNEDRRGHREQAERHGGLDGCAKENVCWLEQPWKETPDRARRPPARARRSARRTGTGGRRPHRVPGTASDSRRSRRVQVNVADLDGSPTASRTSAGMSSIRPWACTSLSAFFGPMPFTPSLKSVPIRIATSIICARSAATRRVGAPAR